LQTHHSYNQKGSAIFTLPLVTLAIPTYKRPQLLKRAISSAIAQDYPNLEILISDNGTPENASDPVVAEFMAKDSRITYFKQEKNIYGDNFFFLLEKAKGEFFMWLADDDQITPNFASALAKLLISDPSIACAFTRYTITDNKGKPVERCFEYSHLNIYLRVLKFIFKGDDAFIYGLNRTAYLQTIPFRHWWWPNRNIPTNSAYPYLFDVVCLGPVCLAQDETVRWIWGGQNQEKFYQTEIGNKYLDLLFFFIRRINLYYEYARRGLARKGWGLFSFVIMLAPFALAKDYYLYIQTIIINRIEAMKNRQ
jgi:glycosyltransferase involved in cell wall biosynthesis